MSDIMNGNCNKEMGILGLVVQDHQLTMKIGMVTLLMVKLEVDSR